MTSFFTDYQTASALHSLTLLLSLALWCHMCMSIWGLLLFQFPPLSVLLCCINFHSHAASVSLWASSCIELSARLPSHNLVRIFVAIAWLHLRFLPSSWLELHHEACQHFRAAILCLVHIHIHMYMWYTCTIYLSIILAFRIARCCPDCRVALNFKAFSAWLQRTLCPYI